MDKRKLIGTIIGVTLFAALIAGATFAWLTFSVNVTNGSYTANTMEFVINYTGNQTGISNVPVLGKGTASTAAKTSISAYRSANSPDGTMEIKMSTTSSNLLTTSGVLKYAVCTGTSSAAGCSKDFTSANVSATNKILAVGEINITGLTKNASNEYTVTLHTLNTIPTTQTYYWVYYWMDGASFTNDMVNLNVSGYIHASATQK